MNKLDEYIKKKAREEECEVPDSVREKIDRTLLELPDKESKIIRFHAVSRIVTIAACFFFVMLVVLPNCSTVYAKTLEKVPVIGDIVKVITIRNYFYADNSHEMDIHVPKIEDNESHAVDYINKDVEEITKILADRFYEEIEENGGKGYSGIYVDYETVTNTEKWFTLKICVSESAGSSNTYYKYYHIDKAGGKIVTLKDLFTTTDYSGILEDEIKQQMKVIMDEDPDKTYWIDDAQMGQDFVGLDSNHNFYWNEKNDLVIVFDKYEVAPGYMGTPEFIIERESIADILVPEYR